MSNMILRYQLRYVVASRRQGSDLLSVKYRIIVQLRRLALDI